jgi:hypothetical protein
MEQTPARADRPGQDAGAIADKLAATKNDAQNALRDAAEPVKESVQKALDEQKAAGANRIADLGNAVDSAADEIGKELPQAAPYIHSAAESLRSASSALRERSIEDLVTSFTTFAREQPASAFAGSLLAGFALSRFLKSSHPARNGR